VDPKRLHIFHTMIRTEDGREIATAEQMLLHVDTNLSKAVPADPAVLAKLAAIVEAQGDLERPKPVGRYVGAPRS
jgi:carnitine 3-dehydrogenase